MHVEARRDGPEFGTTRPYLTFSVVVVRGGDHHGQEFIFWRETIYRGENGAAEGAAARQAEQTQAAWEFINHVRVDD